MEVHVYSPLRLHVLLIQTQSNFRLLVDATENFFEPEWSSGHVIPTGSLFTYYITFYILHHFLHITSLFTYYITFYILHHFLHITSLFTYYITFYILHHFLHITSLFTYYITFYIFLQNHFYSLHIVTSTMKTSNKYSV